MNSYCTLIQNQLNFVLTFVEDLLDLQQLKNGSMQLENDIFNPEETFKLVFDVFEPQTWTRNNRIVFRGR